MTPLLPHPLTRRQGWLLTLAATFTMTISYVDRQNVAVLAPTITAALGISETGYGLVASAFSLAYLLGAPLSGRMIDRVGARRGLLGAVLVWTAVSALHSVVPGFGMLIALRVALGFAESPSFPGASQTVHRALPREERPRGIGVLFTGSSIGAMLAPPLAVQLAARFGWRGALLVSSLVGLLWVPLWLWVAWREPARSVLDAPPEDALPAAAEGEEAAPVWHNPALRRALVLIVCASPVIGFFLTWNAKFLVRSYGITQLMVGRYAWLPPLFFDLGAIGFGDLAARLARRPGPHHGATHPQLLTVAATLAVGATLAVALVARGPWSAEFLAGVAMLGGGGSYAMLTSDMLARIPSRQVSAAGGLCASAQSLAFVIANPLIGRGVERFHGYREILCVLALCVLPGVLAWRLWPRIPPPRLA